MIKAVLKNIKIYDCNFLIPWQSFFDSFFFTIEATCCQFKFDISGSTFNCGGRTGLMVRASDSGSGDPGSILGRVGVFVSLSKRHLLPKSTGNTQE